MRFEEAARLALDSHEPAVRLALAQLACQLWTAGEEGPLEDLYVDLIELRAEVLLRHGQLAAAIRILAPETWAHPGRDRLWTLLAEAQRACGRYAEAASTLAALRSRPPGGGAGSVTRRLRVAG